MAESEHGSVTHNIDLARGGDRDAKAWLWERYRRLLYTMAHDRSDDDTRSGANDTSDVVGEVGVRLSKGDLFDNVKDRKHFQLLLRQVVRGKAIDLQRREAARPTIPFGDEEEIGRAHV